jgi:hypothetical protein
MNNNATFNGPVTITFNYGSILYDVASMNFAFSSDTTDTTIYKDVTILTSSDGTNWTTIYGPVNTPGSLNGMNYTIINAL